MCLDLFAIYGILVSIHRIHGRSTSDSTPVGEEATFLLSNMTDNYFRWPTVVQPLLSAPAFEYDGATFTEIVQLLKAR